MVCPCKNCKDRWVTDTSRCHSTCPKYAEWKAYVDTLNHRSTAVKARNNRVGTVLYGRKNRP